MRKIAFVPPKIEATAGTGASLAVNNRDLFWHTFTIRSLDLEVAVSTGSTRVLTIDGEPGTYEFVCAIPGHEGAGLKGTLTLR